MSAERLARLGRQDEAWNEVEDVLAILDDMARRVASPVIRACLEAARDDIAHLAGPATDEGGSPPA
jgi:hypothetical protein